MKIVEQNSADNSMVFEIDELTLNDIFNQLCQVGSIDIETGGSNLKLLFENVDGKKKMSITQK